MNIAWLAKLGLAVTKAVLIASIAKSSGVSSLYFNVKLGMAFSSSRSTSKIILAAFVGFGPKLAWQNESVIVRSNCVKNKRIANLASSSSVMNGSNK